MAFLCADYSNCYFNDPTVNWNASLHTDAESGVVSFNSSAHRKIRLYRSTSNGVSPEGHGTHTMGSLLGSPINTSDVYQMNYRLCFSPSWPFMDKRTCL